MSKLIKFIIHNHLLVLVLAALIVGFGVHSYKKLPIEAFPDVSPSLVQVFTETEGLSPEDVEKYVSFPIETVMNGLPKVKTIRSVSNLGLSVVNIYFEDDTDIYFARQIVNEKLQEAKSKIPAEFGDPKLGPISTGMGLVLFYYLQDKTGNYSLEELRTIQDWIIKLQLQTVQGVTEVLSIGGFVKQYQVIIKPNSLLRYGLTINELVESIRRNNQNIGAQFIEKNGEEYIVRSVGLISKLEEIENITIKSVDGTPILLKDIAKIKIGGAVRRGIQTHNGTEEVISGMVIKLFGTNSSTVIERVEEKIDQINDNLPEGVELVPYYEQKSLIKKCVSTVKDALFQGIILVILVIMLFIGAIRPSIVVALSIPFSILFAMIAMKAFGITANLMSFGGLAIAIGMMVDASIVIVENIDTKLKNKKLSLQEFKKVLLEASTEVIQPIIFAILIIICVFLPLFTLSGVEGKMFRPLAYTVSLAMFGSLLYAVFVVPVISDLMMRFNAGAKAQSSKLVEFSEYLMGKAIFYYEPLIKFFVANRKSAIKLVVILLAIGSVFFSFLGSEFTPKLQEGTIVVRLTMAPSTALEENKRVTMLVEKRLKKIHEISDVVTRIGRGEVGAHTDPVNNSEMYIILKPKNQWRLAKNQKDIESLIRKQLKDVPGVLMNFTQPIEMTVDELLEGVRAELAIKLFGDDLEVLKEKADEISSVVSKVKGARDVQVDQISGTPQLLITVDKKAISKYGINVNDVQGVIKAAIGGEVAGQVFQGIRRFDILVRFKENYRESADLIGQILIRSPNGVNVPLSQLSKIEEIVGPRQITRENSQRFITIQCNVRGRDIGSFVEDAQKAIKEKAKLPLGYYVTWGGQFKLQQEANKRLLVVIPITLLLVFLLLYSNFHSVKNSLLILLNIPLALVGGIVALWLTGQNLSVPASIGFIALFGIALENGMVLLAYLNQLVREGISIDEASIKAACMRLRPVIMTAVTTGLGLIPLLFSFGTGSEVQRPLATVVLGGLITSTALTLLVLPAVYKWFAEDYSSTKEDF